MTTFRWIRCLDYNDMKEIYEYAIPQCDIWERDIVKDHPDFMRGYIAYDSSNNVIACGVIGKLIETNTMYIDCFTISNSIRGNHLSYEAWNTFLDFVKKDFDINTERLIIEVYHKNINIWRKVMGVEISPIDSDVIKPGLVEKTVIMERGMRNIDDSFSVYDEWYQFGSKWCKKN